MAERHPGGRPAGTGSAVKQRYVIAGEPVSGKNSARIKWWVPEHGKRRPYIAKSERAASWLLWAVSELTRQRIASKAVTFRSPVRVMCDVYQLNATPDLDNSLNLISDSLQQACVLEDDALIVEWNARKFLVADLPRVELTVIPMED